MRFAPIVARMQPGHRNARLAIKATSGGNDFASGEYNDVPALRFPASPGCCMFSRSLLLGVFVLFGFAAWADEDGPAEGHSVHGEAFNEGPRQAGRLIEGLSPIEFATSTKSPTAQRFFLQGVAQLHGFWYWEAERSFRQAVAEDPDMAIAYWGMAMANTNNPDRARGMIDEAMERRENNADDRERGYIEALDKLIKKADGDNSKDAKRGRAEGYIAGIEKILHDHPDDVEAKAFLAHAIWAADRDGVKLTSRYVVEALLKRNFCGKSDASGTSLPDSPLGFREARKRDRIGGDVWSVQSRDRAHVAHARSYLFQAETVQRCRLATGGVRASRSRSHDPHRSDAAPDS